MVQHQPGLAYPLWEKQTEWACGDTNSLRGLLLVLAMMHMLGCEDNAILWVICPGTTLAGH